MAQISDVMHASAVFDAARQELAWTSSGDFDVPEPMRGAVHTISEVLNEAQMRWLTSTRESMAAVVATGDGEKNKKREDVEVMKEVDTRSVEEAKGKIKSWLEDLEKVTCNMRAVARKELLGDDSKIDAAKPIARWLPCLPRTRRAAKTTPTIGTVARDLEELKGQYHGKSGRSTGLPLAVTCKEQPACSSATGNVLVERDDDVKQRIMDIIRLSGDDSATILTIFGPPCVGKTTLVKSVFDDDAFEEFYKGRMDVGKGWDIKKIHETIIDELLEWEHFDGYSDKGYCYVHKVESEADYGRYIFEMLSLYDTRLLLVLDNLVEKHLSMLDKLLESLQKDVKRVIAIMITRSEDLAWYIARCSNHARYRLHPCSDDMCWKIIKQTSGLDLEATAAGTEIAVSEKVRIEIASKCSGIPLAAKALGRFLQSVYPKECPGSFEKEWPGLIGDVWNIGGGFSRDSLPTHSATVFAHLKSVLHLEAESWLFLAYCAFVFPKGKDHGVVTCDLLNQWCSLGITTRERGVSCISELLGNSLLLGEKPASYICQKFQSVFSKKKKEKLQSDSDSEDETEDETKDETNDETLWRIEDLAATLLRMEDLMHDFARYLLSDRLIVVDAKNGATPSTSSPVNNNKSSSAYLALLSNFDAKQLDISSILPAGILALRFDGCGKMELTDGAFESFGKYLRLLDLSGYSENKKMPGFIRHLKQLRYLKAPGIQDKKLPSSITGLHELSYLILRGSCQLELIEAFQLLSNLLHLDLSGCSGLKELPDSFKMLWRLEYLDLSECSRIETLPESFCWLPNLSHLDLSCCSRLKALPKSFGDLSRLSHLDLSRCSELKTLPESFGRLSRLWHLDLSRCSGLQDLPKSFQDLTELRHLDLSGLSSPQALPVSLPRKLQHLNLSGCSGLQGEQLPDVPEPNELRHLDLSGCSSVSRLPGSYSTLKKLVHLNLSSCSNLTMLPRAGFDGLEHLDLSYCSQLEYGSMPKNFCLQQLQYLDLSGTFLENKRQYQQKIIRPTPYGMQAWESGWHVKARRREAGKEKEISDLVENIRRRGGRASGPKDASLRGLGTSGTTN